MSMIVSVVSATVDAERETDLRSAFAANLADAGPFIHRAYLARDGGDDDEWRIILVWKGQVAIDDYVQVVGRPPDAKTFLDVGARPNPSVSQVVADWRGGA
ncbi:MAG TPA: hypothetical protein VNT56_03695 [Acidimicrobiales bacterium]|jgi:hypothetical protein|nr:hypothetical protein [Acidimicrobiales bacterium]